MFFCNKRKSMGETIVLALHVAGIAVAVAYAICRICKRCKCREKRSYLPDLDYCGCDGERDVDFGCIVPDTDDDVRSDENAVVNSESRTINTPNPLMD